MADDAQAERTAERALGARIRNLRLAAGLTQADIALAVGMDRAQFARVEHGRHAVAATRLPQIAQALGVSVTEVVDRAWDEAAEPPNGPEVDVFHTWLLGDHRLQLQATRARLPYVVRLACSCSTEPLWQRKVERHFDLLEATRTDASLLGRVLPHLKQQGYTDTRRLSDLEAEVTLAGLGARDLLSALDRADDRWHM
ncbi:MULTISPECIES: helix-turn-helix domain-containing protein [unclassified Nocardioides]|uniref:helix-turn-helix domain-containing protein n=1 Tax=unclassified Nocardioides TaxID=2615069 RepID=UPI003014D04B